MSDEWNKIIEDEDRKISNSDRKYRKYNISFEATGEELAFRMSASYEFSRDLTSDNFIETVENIKLKQALKCLTAKQRQAIDLYFWQGYNQTEVAKIIGCKQRNVSDLILKTKNRIKDYITE